MKFYLRNEKVVIHENAFETDVCNMSAILSQIPGVNGPRPGRWHVVLPLSSHVLPWETISAMATHCPPTNPRAPPHHPRTTIKLPSGTISLKWYAAIMMLSQAFQPMAMQLSFESCIAIGWKASNMMLMHCSFYFERYAVVSRGCCHNPS